MSTNIRTLTGVAEGRRESQQTLHAATQFDFAALEPTTRTWLSKTSLRASADNKIRGVTLAQLDAALAEAHIAGPHAIAIKLDLSRHGILKNFA